MLDVYRKSYLGVQEYLTRMKGKASKGRTKKKAVKSVLPQSADICKLRPVKDPRTEQISLKCTGDCLRLYRRDPGPPPTYTRIDTICHKISIVTFDKDTGEFNEGRPYCACFFTSDSCKLKTETDPHDPNKYTKAECDPARCGGEYYRDDVGTTRVRGIECQLVVDHQDGGKLKCVCIVPQ